MLTTIQDRFCRAVWIPETRPGSARELLQVLISWLNCRPRRARCRFCRRFFWYNGLQRNDHCSHRCYEATRAAEAEITLRIREKFQAE